MVRVAEAAGVVVVQPDPDDGRASRVSLTGRARELETVLPAILQRVEARFVGDLPDHQVVLVRDGLLRLVGS